MRRIITITCTLLLCLATHAQRITNGEKDGRTSWNTVPQTVIEVRKAGGLADMLTQEQQDTCTSLIVKGNLNSADIRVLRRMAGYSDDGETTGKLAFLDLQDATFVTDKEPYMILDAGKEKLAATALPGRVRNQESVMGVTPSGGNALFYNKQSDIPNYSSRTDLMIVRTESTSNYHPQYYLGRRSDLAINASSNVSVGFDYGQSISASVPSEGQFFFSEGLNEHDWKVMKKKRITRFTGHRIEKVEDKYTLYANSQEGYFPHDMFYKCGCLQSVILPRGLRVNYTVIDETSKVKYNIPSDEITILFIRRKFRNRRYYPEYLGSYGIERKKCITGDSAKSLICAFKDLSPAQADTGYKMDARASFHVEYSNGHDPEHYYLGLDGKYIQKGEHSGQYYEMSDKLRSELREIGIL